LYPADGGIDMFSRKLAEGIEKNGGTIYLNTEIDSFECEGSQIKSYYFQGKHHHPTSIIWTAPLTTLINLLKLPPSDIRYLSIVLYNVEVRGPCKTKYQWCYYGQNDTTINRISVPALFSKDVSPEGYTGICAEVTCFEDDEVWNNPERSIDKVIADLVKVNLINGKEDIKNIHVEKILNTYPVYDIDYQKKLGKIMEALSPYKELQLLGRTGTFWYNNMDHSIRMAMDLVKDKLGTNLHTYR